MESTRDRLIEAHLSNVKEHGDRIVGRWKSAEQLSLLFLVTVLFVMYYLLSCLKEAFDILNR